LAIDGLPKRPTPVAAGTSAAPHLPPVLTSPLLSSTSRGIGLAPTVTLDVVSKYATPRQPSGQHSGLRTPGYQTVRAPDITLESQRLAPNSNLTERITRTPTVPEQRSRAFESASVIRTPGPDIHSLPLQAHPHISAQDLSRLSDEQFEQVLKRYLPGSKPRYHSSAYTSSDQTSAPIGSHSSTSLHDTPQRVDIQPHSRSEPTPEPSSPVSKLSSRVSNLQGRYEAMLKQAEYDIVIPNADSGRPADASSGVENPTRSQSGVQQLLTADQMGHSDGSLHQESESAKLVAPSHQPEQANAIHESDDALLTPTKQTSQTKVLPGSPQLHTDHSTSEALTRLMGALAQANFAKLTQAEVPPNLTDLKTTAALLELHQELERIYTERALQAAQTEIERARLDALHAEHERQEEQKRHRLELGAALHLARALLGQHSQTSPERYPTTKSSSTNTFEELETTAKTLGVADNENDDTTSSRTEPPIHDHVPASEQTRAEVTSSIIEDASAAQSQIEDLPQEIKVEASASVSDEAAELLKSTESADTYKAIEDTIAAVLKSDSQFEGDYHADIEMSGEPSPDEPAEQQCLPMSGTNQQQLFAEQQGNEIKAILDEPSEINYLQKGQVTLELQLYSLRNELEKERAERAQEREQLELRLAEGKLAEEREEGLRSQLRQYEERIAQLTETNDSLKRELADSKLAFDQSLTDLQQRLTDKQSELDAATSDLMSARAELEQQLVNVRQLEASHVDVQEQLQAAQAALLSAQTETSARAAELEQAGKELEATRDLLAQRDEESSQLKGELTKIQEALMKAQESAHTLSMSQSKLAQCERDAEAYRNEVTKLQEQLEQSQKVQEEAKHELNEAQRTLEHTRDELATTQHQLQEVQRYATKLEQDLKLGQEQKQIQDEAMKKLQELLNAFQDNLKLSQEEYNMYEDQLIGIRTELATTREQLEAQLSAKQGELNALQNELQHVKEELSETQQRESTANDELSRCKNELSVLSEEVASLRAEKERLLIDEHKWNGIKNELKEMEDVVHQSMALQEKVQSLTQDLTSVNQLLAASKAQLATTEERLNTSQGQLESAREQVALQEESIKTYQNEIAQLRDHLAGAQRELENAISERTEREAQVTEVQARLSSIEADYLKALEQLELLKSSASNHAQNNDALNEAMAMSSVLMDKLTELKTENITLANSEKSLKQDIEQLRALLESQTNAATIAEAQVMELTKEMKSFVLSHEEIVNDLQSQLAASKEQISTLENRIFELSRTAELPTESDTIPVVSDEGADEDARQESDDMRAAEATNASSEMTTIIGIAPVQAPQVESLKAELKTQLTELIKSESWEIDDVDSKIAALQDLINEHVQSSVTENELIYNHATLQLQAMQIELEKIKEDWAASEQQLSRIPDLESQLAAEKERVSELQEVLVQRETELFEAQEQIQQCLKDIDDLTIQLAAASSPTTQDGSENEALTPTPSDAQTDAHASHEVERELAEARERVTEVEAALAQERVAKDKITKEFERLAAEYSAEVDRLKADLAREIDVRTKLYEDLAEASNAKLNLETMYAALLQEKQAAEAKVGELASELTYLAAKADELKKSHIEKEEQLTNELKASNEHIARIEAQLSELAQRREHADGSDSAADSEQEHEALMTRIQALEKERDELSAKCKEMTELVEMSAQIQNEIDRITEEYVKQMDIKDETIRRLETEHISFAQILTKLLGTEEMSEYDSSHEAFERHVKAAVDAIEVKEARLAHLEASLSLVKQDYEVAQQRSESESLLHQEAIGRYEQLKRQYEELNQLYDEADREKQETQLRLNLAEQKYADILSDRNTLADTAAHLATELEGLRRQVESGQSGKAAESEQLSEQLRETTRAFDSVIEQRAKAEERIAELTEVLTELQETSKMLLERTDQQAAEIKALQEENEQLSTLLAGTQKSLDTAADGSANLVNRQPQPQAESDASDSSQVDGRDDIEQAPLDTSIDHIRAEVALLQLEVDRLNTELAEAKSEVARLEGERTQWEESNRKLAEEAEKALEQASHSNAECEASRAALEEIKLSELELKAKATELQRQLEQARKMLEERSTNARASPSGRRPMRQVATQADESSSDSSLPSEDDELDLAENIAPQPTMSRQASPQPVHTPSRQQRVPTPDRARTPSISTTHAQTPTEVELNELRRELQREHARAEALDSELNAAVIRESSLKDEIKELRAVAQRKFGRKFTSTFSQFDFDDEDREADDEDSYDETVDERGHIPDDSTARKEWERDRALLELKLRELEEAHGLIRTREEQLRALQDKHAQERDILLKKIADAEANATAAADVSAAHTARLAEEIQLRESAEAALLQATLDRERLEQATQELTAQYEKYVTEASKRTQLLYETEDALASAQKDLAAATAEVAMQQNKIDQLQKELAEAQTGAAEELQAKHQQLEAALSRMAQIEVQLHASKQSQEKLEKQLVDTMSALESTQAELTGARDTIQSLQNQLAQLEQASKSLESSQTDKLEQAKQAETELAATKSALEQTKQLVQSQADRVTQLESIIQSYEVQVNQYRQQIESSTAQLESLSSQKDQAMLELEATQRELAAARDSMQSLQATMQQLLETTNQLSSEREQLSTALQRSEAEVKQLLEQKQTLEAKATALETAVSEARQQTTSSHDAELLEAFKVSESQALATIRLLQDQLALMTKESEAKALISANERAEQERQLNEATDQLTQLSAMLTETLSARSLLAGAIEELAQLAAHSAQAAETGSGETDSDHLPEGQSKIAALETAHDDVSTHIATILASIRTLRRLKFANLSLQIQNLDSAMPSATSHAAPLIVRGDKRAPTPVVLTPRLDSVQVALPNPGSESDTDSDGETRGATEATHSIDDTEAAELLRLAAVPKSGTPKANSFAKSLLDLSKPAAFATASGDVPDARNILSSTNVARGESPHSATGRDTPRTPEAYEDAPELLRETFVRFLSEEQEQDVYIPILSKMLRLTPQQVERVTKAREKQKSKGLFANWI